MYAFELEIISPTHREVYIWLILMWPNVTSKRNENF